VLPLNVHSPSGLVGVPMRRRDFITWIRELLGLLATASGMVLLVTCWVGGHCRSRSSRFTWSAS
jgi:hypothetical protein